jgi:hypothetical protein
MEMPIPHSLDEALEHRNNQILEAVNALQARTRNKRAEMIDLYSRVKLVSKKYEDDNGFFGMIGFVIEVYLNSRYEVEFSDANGITLALFSVDEEDIIPFPVLD